MSKALHGRDGHLFLVNDHNAVQSQTSGDVVMEPPKLNAIYQSHAACSKRSSAGGGAYIHVIAPNKETAYREFLPEGYGYETVGPTPIKQYFSSIPEAKGLTFFDPDLLVPKPGMVTYDKGESHWTPQGALAYITKAFEYFGRNDDADRIRSIKYEMGHFDRQGDIAGHAGLPPEPVAHIKPIDVKQVCHFWGDISNEGYVRHYTSGSGRGRALILHDSFGQALFPFLSEIYAESLFTHCPNYALDIEASFKPDVVIKIQVERFFPYIPKTYNSIINWIADVERAKGTPGKTTAFLASFLEDPQS